MDHPMSSSPGAMAQQQGQQQDDGSLARCKRRINFGYTLPNAPQPAAVARRNARERNRVKQVNLGFSNLRQHIPGMAPVPTTAKGKKLSKVETLKCAVEYIKNLKCLLDDPNVVLRHHSDGQSSSSSSVGSANTPNTDACMSPAGSDASTSSSTSPTPSYGSEGTGSSYVATTLTAYDNYENYEPMSPEDEVLLDAISWWQQTQ